MPFHVVSYRSTDAESNCREVENREAKTDFGERSRARKVGGEWQIAVTVQLEALKAIAVFEASAQPQDASPSREYLLSMLERYRTKRNETVNGVYLESCASLSFGFVRKPNGIDIGNVFLTRTVRVFNKKKRRRHNYIEHGQNVKIHFSITLDINGICEIFGVHLCFNMLCHAKIHLKLKVKLIMYCRIGTTIAIPIYKVLPTCTL